MENKSDNNAQTPAKDPFGISIELEENNLPFLHIYNCDKDGSTVVKRISSCIGAISDTRDINLANIPIYIHPNYVNEVAERIVNYYSKLPKVKSSISGVSLNFQTLVFGSVHRASLYIAEVLHCPVLPLQFIGWARNLEECAKDTTSCLKIAGSDFDNKNIWVWNKITKRTHIPHSYLELIKNAETIIIVRSNSVPDGEGERYIGKYNGVYIHNSIKPDYLNIHLDVVDEQTSKRLKQWEWGLPDETIRTFKFLWEHELKRNIENFIVIEGETVKLFQNITELWLKYLKQNNCCPQGISFNPYWTAHPLYERIAGIIPIHFYNFRIMKEYAQVVINNLKSVNYLKDAKNSQIYAFANKTEGERDVEELRKFMEVNKMVAIGHFSIGYDIKDADCYDIYKCKIQSPYKFIQEWIQDSDNIPYKDITFKPLMLKDVIDAFSTDILV